MKPAFSPTFPLAPFLSGLSAAGIHLTLDDLRRVQQVLETDTAWTPARLRQVLLVLLAKNAQQREDFERLYQQFQQAEDGDTTQQAVDITRLQQDLQQLVVQFEQQQKQPKIVQPEVVNTPEYVKIGRFWWIVTLLIAGVFIGTLIVLNYWNKPVSQQLASKSITTTTALPTVDSTPSPILPPSPLAGEGSGMGGNQEPDNGVEAKPKENKTAEAQPPEVAEKPPEANTKPQPTDTTVVEQPPAQPEVPPSQPSTNWSLGLWWLAALGSGLLTLYLWLRLHKSRQMPELPTALHWQQDSEVYFDPAEVGGAMSAWLDDATLDYCADSIGFYVAEDESRWLDVPATIKASAQAAGLPEVRMQSQRSLFQILVLVDVTAPEQRWCPLAYELVAGLRQRGLPVTLGYLHGSLREFRTDEGELIRLEELAEERGRYVTLVFADARQADWQQDKLLLEELALWPQLAWLTVREPRFWNGRERRLQAAGIRLWTAEPDNLIPVFRELAGEMVQTILQQPVYQRFMQRGAKEPLAGYVQRLLGDAVPLARIVAVLPPPVSPALLVRMLREFAPHLPLTRLQRLYALPNTQSDASGLNWSVDVLRLLRGQFHQWCRGEEKYRVQARLLGWYRSAKPDNEGNLRYYAWYWRYLRLLLEFSPKQAIPAMEQLQVSVAPLQAQIEQELQQDALPFPLPDADDGESRKRLMRISKGKVISEDVVWPALRSRKREVAGGLLLTALLVSVAIWQSLPQMEKPIEIVVAEPVKASPSVERVKEETPPSLPLSGEELKIALPVMLKIPGGTFEMGCVENKECQDDEKPVHKVTVPAFEIGAYEVTNAQYVAFLNAVGQRGTQEHPWFETEQEDTDKLSYIIEDGDKFAAKPGFEDYPAINISWYGAKAYLDWLSKQTKQAWRLPTEAEWEYAARAGTKTAYSWGDQEPVCDKPAKNGASFNGGGTSSCYYELSNGKYRGAEKVGSFKPNPLGLYDVHGNAWEWVEDCWQGDYKDAPIDGSARQGCDADASRVLRGGSWYDRPRWLRSAYRDDDTPASRSRYVGFRAARTINPLPFTEGGTQAPLAQAPQEGQAVQLALPATVTDTQKVPAPTMVQIPAGKFTMGCDPKRDDVEGGCFDSEKPAHEVSVPTFWLSETEVTVAQYMACVKAGACPEPEWQEKGSVYNINTGTSDLYKKMGEALTGDNYPIVGVSWQNAQAYVQWLSKQTSKKYRLPTEAEWEYAARAGTDTAYSWGNSIGKNNANCSGNLCGEKFAYTSPVGSFTKSPFGLSDMHGNVYEWVEDCWQDDYKDAPIDGSARQGCAANAWRVLRGGSWNDIPLRLRSAERNFYAPADRFTKVGFRAARTN